MESNTRRVAALELLAKTGMSRGNYEPPAVRLLWRMGIDAPPPHFATFAGIALLAGLLFGVAMGLAVWLIPWQPHPASPAVALTTAVVGGVIFGLGLAIFYAAGRRRHKLPPWDSFRKSETVANFPSS